MPPKSDTATATATATVHTFHTFHTFHAFHARTHTHTRAHARLGALGWARRGPVPRPTDAPGAPVP